MTGEVVANEFAKMRHLRVGVLVPVLFALILGIVLYAITSDPSFAPGSDEAWNLLLNGICHGTLIASPLLLAVLASRQVDIEHQGNGWLLSATSGATPGRLCRAKFVSLGVLIVGAIVLASVIAFGIAVAMLGTGAPVPIGRWAGVTVSATVVSLVILAVQLLLAAKIENQLVGIGVGLLGIIFAMISVEMPAWVQHLVPWGYYALGMPAEYRDGVLVEIAPSFASVGILGAVAAALFILLTGLFDRQEA
ncbi:ABC transporter permease [Gulosibacter sp. 10]|uniref:ABC transporter permease n=1 Tax=Gulosibacter sp. 10 TaxID=1255570 RepID=UPI00097F1984|nr:ABC transporter permease [Gulosibacter sp. 10]SJM70002.1 hypothetical protein FM112_14605 [Gulosibacter sp. 10]